jgi:hypothetical protein
VKPPELELAQEVGSQVASSANLLAVYTEVVERLLDPAENELQNVAKLFQRTSSGTEISLATSGVTFNNTTEGSGDHNKMGVGMNRTPTFRRSPKRANTSGACSGERDASSGVCGPRLRENKGLVDSWRTKRYEDRRTIICSRTHQHRQWGTRLSCRMSKIESAPPR